MNLSQEIVLLILGAWITGAFGMWCFMKHLGYTRWASGHSKGWLHDRYIRQDRRSQWIKIWATNVMVTVPLNLKTKDRKILVSYEDVLKVWDNADQIWNDLSEYD